MGSRFRDHAMGRCLGNLIGIVSKDDVWWSHEECSPYGPRGPPLRKETDIMPLRSHTPGKVDVSTQQGTSEWVQDITTPQVEDSSAQTQ